MSSARAPDRRDLEFDPAGLCMGGQRERYAVQALQAAGGGSNVGSEMFVSAQLGGVCNSVYPLTGSIRGYTNPFERATGVVWERTDQVVDARMNPGSPLLVFAPSKVELIVPDFYAGEPAIVFEVTAGPLADKWWYWSEQIQPTVSQGQTVAAGQSVATYAPAGTGIEIGWWTPGGGYPLGHPGYAEGLATTLARTFAISYGRWVPTLVLVSACPAAKRWAIRTTRPGTRGRVPPRDRAAHVGDRRARLGARAWPPATNR